MFDIGIFELFVIVIVALLVIGPEELPTAARKLGLWVGNIRRHFFSIKDEVSREFQLDDQATASNDDETQTPPKKFQPSLDASKRKV